MITLQNANSPSAFVARNIAAAQPARSARNGKVARLPKETRDLINHMLDDGLPARVIIDELGEAGEGLNPQNISNWRQGGYQDYLRNQELIARAKAQVELAIDLLRETGSEDALLMARAANLVASIQLFDAIRNYGDEALRKTLQLKPTSYFQVVHSVCALSDSELHRAKHQLQTKLTHLESNPIKPNQADQNFSPPPGPATLNSQPSTTSSEPAFRIKPNQTKSSQPK